MKIAEEGIWLYVYKCNGLLLAVDLRFKWQVRVLELSSLIEWGYIAKTGSSEELNNFGADYWISKV